MADRLRSAGRGRHRRRRGMCVKLRAQRVCCFGRGDANQRLDLWSHLTGFERVEEDTGVCSNRDFRGGKSRSIWFFLYCGCADGLTNEESSSSVVKYVDSRQPEIARGQRHEEVQKLCWVFMCIRVRKRSSTICVTRPGFPGAEQWRCHTPASVTDVAGETTREAPKPTLNVK